MPSWLVAVDGLHIKSEPRTSRRSMVIRLGGLAVLLAAAAAFGAGRLPDPPGTTSLDAPNVPTEQVVVQADQPTTTAEADDRQQATLPDVTADETEIALGVGGENGEIVTSNTPTPTATTEATQEPTPEPTATEAATQAATEAPTEQPTEEPTQEPTPEPTATTAPTQEPTPEPTEALTLPQGPSVASGETPDPVVVANNFRYTVESARRGVEFPELGLTNTGYGEWVVAVVDVRNDGDSAAAFNMSNFNLQTTGPSATLTPLDSGTEMVAQNLGFTPAYGATNSALFASGESHRVALVFLITTDTQTMSLVVGEQSLDLADVIAEATDPATLGDAGEPARLFEGTVANVVSGNVFTVEVEGVEYQVRINGIDAPQGDSCFAAESTTAAKSLLEGKTVLLERERTNLDDSGNMLRDVWVVGEDGNTTLAAAALVTEGAATAAPEGSNTRYAGWVADASDAASVAGTGLWSACAAE